MFSFENMLSIYLRYKRLKKIRNKKHKGKKKEVKRAD